MQINKFEHIFLILDFGTDLWEKETFRVFNNINNYIVSLQLSNFINFPSCTRHIVKKPRISVTFLQPKLFSSLFPIYLLLQQNCLERAARMKDLRSIALCNVLYKIISKVLCNRLKHVLPALIDPGPAISHLMFADDSLFFCRATLEECTLLRNIFLKYETYSGQAINFQKSGIFFSKNVENHGRDTISNLLGVRSQSLNTGRYLGLPSLVSRNKRAIFQYIRERMWDRIQGWRGKKLSKAGKKIMIKAVAQAIPAYCMS